MSAIKNFYHDQICEGMAEANEEITQEQIDEVGMFLSDYEKRKQAILESDMPAFFGPDPSIF